MPVEFKVPELGENVETGSVVSVLVSVGDTIDVDQPILELETDKAVLEVPSSVSGVIQALFVKEGDEIGPGHVVLTVGEGHGAATESDVEDATATSTAPAEVAATPAGEPALAATEAPASTATADPPAPPAVVTFQLPELGENVEAGTVVNILVSIGDTIDVDQPLLELETDKAVLEVPADVSGVVQEILVSQGDTAGPGDAVIKIQTGDAAPSTGAPPAAAPSAPVPASSPAEESAQSAQPAAVEPQTDGNPPVSNGTPSTDELKHFGEKLYDIAPASPTVRRFAREIGIDIHYVPGSGQGGRVSIDDVKAFSRQLQAKLAEVVARPVPTAMPAQPGFPTTGIVQQPLPNFTKWGDIEREPMKGIRRATARNLGYAWATIPHVTQHDKTDVTELEAFRKQYAKRVEAAGAKFTPTAIILKVLAAALKTFPQFNTSVDMENTEIIYKKYCHIGVAVDTPNGLLVPVIRDADQKNLVELSVELGEIAQKARNRKLALDEMQGGSITLTNLGGIGGTQFTPIINPPEVAILGVSRSRMEPVWTGNDFEPRLMMPLSLSYDHRVIDGAAGARFLRWICEVLENPFVMLLEG